MCVTVCVYIRVCTLGLCGYNYSKLMCVYRSLHIALYALTRGSVLRCSGVCADTTVKPCCLWGALTTLGGKEKPGCMGMRNSIASSEAIMDLF